MGNLELAGTLKALSGEREQLQKELAKLDKAIAVLRELSGMRPAPNGHLKKRTKRTLSAAARRKIAAAQKLRWERVRQGKAAKR
jgi:hypothetical protein